MSDNRRYNEDEVRRIFEVATEAPEATDAGPGALASHEGMSLAEVKEIGAEVGLSPERIEAAAARIRTVGSPAPPKRIAGMPLSVGRAVDLPRAPTDHEWELLVAELRSTFGARGKVASEGSSRRWNNGNLHAYIEPTEAGHRLRLGSLKGNAVAGSRMGTVAIATALLMLVVSVVVGSGSAIGGATILGVAGVMMLVTSLGGLRGWANERDSQNGVHRRPRRRAAEPATRPGVGRGARPRIRGSGSRIPRGPSIDRGSLARVPKARPRYPSGFGAG